MSLNPLNRSPEGQRFNSYYISAQTIQLSAFTLHFDQEMHSLSLSLFFLLYTIYTVLYVFWPFIKSCILSRNPLLSIHVFSKYSFLFLIICKLHMQTFCLMLIVVCFIAVYFVGLFCAKKESFNEDDI